MITYGESNAGRSKVLDVIKKIASVTGANVNSPRQAPGHGDCVCNRAVGVKGEILNRRHVLTWN